MPEAGTFTKEISLFWITVLEAGRSKLRVVTFVPSWDDGIMQQGHVQVQGVVSAEEDTLEKDGEKASTPDP